MSVLWETGIRDSAGVIRFEHDGSTNSTSSARTVVGAEHCFQARHDGSLYTT